MLDENLRQSSLTAACWRAGVSCFMLCMWLFSKWPGTSNVTCEPLPSEWVIPPVGKWKDARKRKKKGSDQDQVPPTDWWCAFYQRLQRRRSDHYSYGHCVNPLFLNHPPSFIVTYRWGNLTFERLGSPVCVWLMRTCTEREADRPGACCVRTTTVK